jgi:pyruvate, water dikinase
MLFSLNAVGAMKQERFMAELIQFFKKILFRADNKNETEETVEELRAAFKFRYEGFRRVLTANTKALDIMNDLENALLGHRPFGMSFIRSNCQAVSANVFRMIKELNELAPGKYSDLFVRFNIIQDRTNELLTRRHHFTGDKFVIPFDNIDTSIVDQVGGKMAKLADVRNRMGLPVPNGFVVTSHAYEKFMEHSNLQAEIYRRISAAESDKAEDLYQASAELQQLIVQAPMPQDLERAILDAYRYLEREAGQNARVVLRSSALGEDAAGRSFAGQFRSELNVGGGNVIEAYKRVVASKYGFGAVAYRLNRGIPDEEVAMCVGVTPMVDAVTGGVMYSCNPLNIRDCAVFINSAWGLPKAVVDGSTDPDVFVVSREVPMRIAGKHIALKDHEFTCDPMEGVCELDLSGEKGGSQSITDDQAVALAKLGTKLEEYYGCPQDVEWAIASDGCIYVLQCRPLQQMESQARRKQIPEPNSEPGPILIRDGITAAPGVAYGPVFIARTEADQVKFPEGGVLVTAQSLPRWASMLNRASAAVAEVGGVAGHLAHVARELGVPALFGVAGATLKLKTGDMVTVDADGRTIYNGRVESILKAEDKNKNLMKGSPVYDTLKEVALHITPLNLFDPDSPQFHPTKCETLHDITRFVHEKALQEMFHFGKEHHFEERSSKQLVLNVPMQWWILNLDDGFRGQAKGKFVKLEDIDCIPMVALWEGITAIPWEGPPPLETRGFMSVLLQATSNPALDPTMKSAYASRNYFMISKNFCSLSSRFGFHLAAVEALVGDQANENHISFSFRGGAADYDRRVNRATLVGNILETFGFRIELKDDGLIARLDGRDAAFMKNRLRVLGYLLMHTRQIDMVMSDAAHMRKYEKRFLTDMAAMLDRIVREQGENVCEGQDFATNLGIPS